MAFTAWPGPPKGARNLDRQIKPRLPEGAEQFNLGAAVHHNLQAGVLSQLGRRIVIDTDLPPDDLGPDRNGVIGNRRNLFTAAKAVDHIDGNRSNNRWANLREATRKTNARNMKRPSNNTSAVAGVSWHKKAGKWRAFLAGKHLGLFVSKSDATRARKTAERKLGFHPNHGRIVP